MPGAARGEELIDGDRVPLHRRTLAAYLEMLEPLRASMSQSGWCLVRGVLRPDAVSVLIGEVERLAPLGHRRAAGGSLTTVAADVISPASALRSLADWEELTRFVADAAGELALFRSADALGATTIEVFVDGDELGAAPEPADVVAIVVLQTPERGGVLSAGADAVAAEPGDLVVLDARRVRRRVTRVEGRAARLDLVAAYSLTAGATLTDGERLARFGRLSAERRRGH